MMNKSIECEECRGHGESLTQGNYYDFEPPTCKCLACNGTGVLDDANPYPEYSVERYKFRYEEALKLVGQALL